MPAGLKEQIDDLDQLLDQLLKLPIDRAAVAPAKVPIKPLAVAQIDEGEQELRTASSILRFDGRATELELADEVEVIDEKGIEVVKHPVQEIPKPEIARVSSIQEPITPSPSPRGAEGRQIPVEEIPWVEDEPSPTGSGRGPQVEIILGPSSNIVMAPTLEENKQATTTAKRRSWLLWIFCTWTWCFDHTLGHWFPWLRRPTVKFILGLIGVALFAVSIYLVWIGWLK